MSHEATAWALRQRGLKPATKIVLWHLCDRYHPDHGCFPAQGTLANDCEMSRSTLNEHLDALEKAGLIRREQRRDAGTFRQRSTLYRLAFEGAAAGFAEHQKEAANGPGTGRPEAAQMEAQQAENAPESRVRKPDTDLQKPCPEKGESRVRIPDTNLVREPVSLEREGACARAGEGKPPQAAAAESGQNQGTAGDGAGERQTDRQAGRDEPRLARLIRLWPGAVAENLPAIRQAWALLNEADRQGAAAHAPDVLAEATKAGRKLTTSLLTYLKGQPWRIAAQAKREAEGRALPEAGEAVRFQNWSRHWWALIIARAAKGLANGFIVSQAARDRAGQWGCKAGDFGPFAPEAMRQLRADTTAGRAWLDWIEAGGGIPGHVAAGQRCHLDITNPERLWLFAPCETPDGLKDWIMQHQAEAAAQ